MYCYYALLWGFISRERGDDDDAEDSDAYPEVCIVTLLFLATWKQYWNWHDRLLRRASWAKYTAFASRFNMCSFTFFGFFFKQFKLDFNWYNYRYNQHYFSCDWFALDFLVHMHIQASYGEMIECESGDDCPYQWFHLDCVGLKRPPKGIQWMEI